MKAIRYLQVTLLLALLIGCAQIGLTPAKTFEDKLAYAVGVHKAVQISAAQSLNASQITSADATAVLRMADDSRIVLDGARAAASLGDMTTANSKLVLAQTALTALQTYLNARSKQ